MIGGTLVNKKRSGFVRTPPNLAVRIGKHLLALPEAAYSVLDPTAGEGDFFYACAHNTQARLFGVEVSAERAAISRQRWPRAEIVQAAIESVHVPTGSMSLILANPPYFFQDGKRAEYRIIADAGEALMPGGVMVAIVPARSAWDGTMINHWLKYYDHIRVWKFPDRHSDEDEGAFEDSTQICVIGVRRKEPQPVTEAEKKRLLGFQWREPKKVGQSGWKYGSPPPTLPDVPLADPYLVPPARTLPRLVVRNADEATLLYALDKSGAHLSASWQQATTWPEEGFAGQPAMPYTGEAHLAAEVMIGGLDGEIVSGPGTGTDAEPHLFTAFVGKEWVSMPVDDELKEKLHEQGCVRVEMRQLMDKPILGVLNLARGTTRYYQGEQVFEFLQPWIPTLSSRVIAKRKPLYRLDPADWELRVLSQFGTDKRLPKAAFAGLAIPQLHRVFAMGRSLDVKGRTAIQGQPGTGKTRLAGGTAKRQAYRWRHRNTMFAGSRQPAWVRELRRAWLKNPLTLDMLGLEPVYGRRITGDRGAQGRIALDPSVHQVVAYRERATGRMLAPEDAGPAALPVLVTTPLKVTKEYGNEIRAAFPQAQVMHLESHRDIPRWLHCCASSHAPVVFGIVSHSLTRAFGREWREVVQEKPQITRVPNLDPDLALLPLLDPVYEQRGSRKLVGYRFKASGELLVKEKRVVYFSCPDCGGIIEAIPGKTNQPDEKEEKGKKAKPKSQNGEEEGDGKVPVTSRTYFATKPRWCKCATSQRGKEREAQGKVALRSPLWQDDRTKATNRKYPQVSFAQWSAAMSALKRQAAREQEAASLPLLAEQVRRDEGLLDQLLALAFADEPARSQLCALTERVDTGVATLRQTVAEQRAALAPILVDAALASREWPQGLEPAVELACRDLQSLQSCMPAITVRKEEVSRLVASLTKSETALRERVRQAIRRDGSHLLLHRLIACTRQQMNWQPVFFRGVFEQAHSITATGGKKQSGGGLGATLDGSRTPLRGVRLTQAESGPISIEEPDRTVAGGYDPVKVPDGTIIGYQMGKGGRVLVPVYGIHSHRVVGYAHDGKLITKKTCFEFTRPPADSFSPYQYLYRFFRGCVALSVIDESHNGRGRSTDIAHSHHFAMLAAQMRQLTSGTHFGGDLIGFYHYWFRYHPRFWLSRGYGWDDAEKALADYGVIQEWVKEYESDARRGSGQTDMYVSTVPAPGLSANMIPGLLEDLTYLTVLDVGAHMPPKREIPKGISMKDPLLEQQKKEMQERVAAARQVVNELQAEQTAIKQTAPGDERDRYLAELAARLQVAQQALKAAQEEEQQVREWREKRDLEAAYAQVVSDLDEAAVVNTAARLAKGTVPRWFAALPCDSPFEVYSTERGDWGDKGERELVIRTPVLASNHLYPLERYFQQVAREQLAVGRRVMFYYEQSTIRSMAKRLEWVLKEFHPWTLPNGVEAEDRQQAILDAVKRGHKIVIVPYRKVNEGLNLQTAIDTIVWAELPMNLFYYTQASQRAWRLGKEKEVQIIIPYYIGSVAHQQVRRLGERDGAAAAFAGEPARGGLIHHAGADQTTLARLSAQIEEGTALLDSGQADDTAEIEAAFARRNEELAEALRRGRQWFGLTDTLPERLQTIMAAQYPPVWADMPAAVPLPEVSLETLKQLDEAIARRGDLSPVAPALPASALQGEVQQLILISPESVSSPEAIPAAVPLAAAPPISATVMVLGGALLFGNETDIARVRRQRGKQRPRLIPKPANPVVVRQIPALEMTQASTPASEPSLMLSIWDL